MRCLGWLLVVLLATPVAAEAKPSIALTECKPPGVGGDALCAKYSVFEDRAAGRGRRIDLNIVVLPARQVDNEPDPIFFLHGGPGGPATALAPYFAGSRLRHDRDIVLVDQRGTGGSNELQCPATGLEDLLRSFTTFDFDDVEACRDALDADLTLYTTSIAMQDLDEVRRALGAETINLIGGSYGTRAALEYARRYPDQTRTMTLRGVAPTTESLPLSFGRSSLAALNSLLEDCRADTACNDAYPKLDRELKTILSRLGRESATTEINDPFSGEQVAVPVDRSLFVATLHYSLYTSFAAARIPAGIHAAYEGDFSPLLQTTVSFAAVLAPQLATGMFLSVVCAEDAPFFSDDEIKRNARGTLLGAEMSRSLKRTCALWPRGKVPDDYKQPVRSAVPTLLISGEQDPVTPPDIAAETAKHLPASRHLVLPETGHGDFAPGCVGRLLEQFIDLGSVEGLDASCVDDIRRGPFVVK